jgi:hypothetical protein
MKAKYKSEFGKVYLDSQSKLDALIKELVTEAAEAFDSEPNIEAVECRARDGFMPFSHNCGGWEATAFDYLNHGLSYSSKEANAQIEKTMQQAMEYGLSEMGLPKDTKWADLNLSEEQEEALREHEDSYLEDETIMVSFRVLYHGVDENGKHSASVSAAINWEAPYHRSHISWMPGFKCETAKEVEVTWKNLREAKTKIKAALAKVGRIF